MKFEEIEEGTRFRLVIREGSLDALDPQGLTPNQLDPVVYIKIKPHLNAHGFNCNAQAVHHRYGSGYIEGQREIVFEHCLPSRSQIPYHET